MKLESPFTVKINPPLSVCLRFKNDEFMMILVIDRGFLPATASLLIFTKYFQKYLQSLNSPEGATGRREEVDDLDQNDQITLFKETSSTQLFKGRQRSP